MAVESRKGEARLSPTPKRDPDYGQIRGTSSPATPEARPWPTQRPRTGRQLDDLTARDLMTPGVVAIVEDALLRHGLRSMVVHRKHAILVVGRTSGYPLGWITDHGLLSHLASDAGLAPVRDAITEDAVTVTPRATAREVSIELSQPGRTHLLVAPLTGGFPEGVISSLDLVEAVS